jgi:hypothetical protein
MRLGREGPLPLRSRAPSPPKNNRILILIRGSLLLRPNGLLLWFFRIFGEGVTGARVQLESEFSGRIEDTQAQQIELGAAVHGALNKLQAVDVAFHGTIAPGVFESCEQSGLVTT